MPLLLTGTLVSPNLTDSRAFIGTDDRNPQTYVAGAILANGARLAEIAAEYVVLEKDGRTERLYAQNVKSHARPQSDLLLVSPAPKQQQAAAPTYRSTFTEFIRPSPVYEGGTLTGYEVYAGQKAGVFGRLGFQAGDVIVAFDGVPVTDPTSATEQLDRLSMGDAMTATVKRKGKTEELSLDGTIVSAELARSNQPVNRAEAIPRG